MLYLLFLTTIFFIFVFPATAPDIRQDPVNSFVKEHPLPPKRAAVSVSPAYSPIYLFNIS